MELFDLFCYAIGIVFALSLAATPTPVAETVVVAQVDSFVATYRLDELTIRELKLVARNKKVVNYSRMTKAQLIAALEGVRG